LQLVERLGPCAEADVYLGKPRRRDIATIGQLRQFVQNSSSAVDPASNSVEIAKGREELGVAPGETNRRFQLLKRFLISALFRVRRAEKEMRHSEPMIQVDRL